MTPEQQRIIKALLAGGMPAGDMSGASPLRQRAMMQQAQKAQQDRADAFYDAQPGPSGVAGAGLGGMTAEPFDPREEMSAAPLAYKAAGGSSPHAGNQVVYKRRSDMMAPDNANSTQRRVAPNHRMTDQEWQAWLAQMRRMGWPIDKEFKRADMSGLTDEERQGYLRQSFVAPGRFPDHGANGGAGGGVEMLRELYQRQSRPAWLQEAINNGDFNPELLDRIARGG